jgi:lactoylglutathione lyase
VRSSRVHGVELAFWATDIDAQFATAVAAGATALTPPRDMPWGQRVAYVQAPEGTIIGYLTRLRTA